MKMNVDYRVDYIMNKEDQIYTDHEIYTITGEPLGFGGSSILYPARREGSSLEVAIKEWFPKLPANFERRKGVIQPKDPSDTVTLKENRKLFEAELMMGREIRNATAIRAINLWDILKPTKLIIKGKEEAESDVSKGLFAVMERLDHKGKSFNQLLRYISEERSADSPLKTGGLPKIHTTALIMEQVLLALQRVHKAGENGYLFGDVQDGNIYFADAQLEQGDIGTGMLLDFGCTKPLTLKEDRKVYEYQGENIFSSQGYIPPEIAKPEAYDWELTDKADIYSAGCLMLRCLLSRAKIKTLGCTPYYRDDLVDEVDASNIGCSESNRRLVNHILENAMMLNPKNRSSVDEMLKEVQQLITDTEPPKYLLPSNLSSPDYFVPHSRDQELAATAKSVNDGETVFLHGIGGIGKTECAIQLAKYLKPPRGAYLVHFQNSIKETILRMNFSGYKFEPKQKGLSLEDLEKAEYKERLEILREYYRDTVLIVDNFDVDNKTLDDLRRESAFTDFLGLDLKRIFTTRYPVGRKDWEIRELSGTDLLALMRYYCTDSSITDAQYLAILKEIQNHTLTAALIAKTLEESWNDITLEMILDALRGSRLSKEDYPEVVSDQNRSYQQKQIYEHLKALFDLSGMSDNDKIVLSYATLLPDDGTNAPLFKKGLQKDDQVALAKLVKRGWINRNDQNRLTIHPVIREVCLGECNIPIDLYDHFLSNLSAQTISYLDIMHGKDVFAIASLFSQTILMHDCALERLVAFSETEIYHNIKSRASKLVNEQGRILLSMCAEEWGDPMRRIDYSRNTSGKHFSLPEDADTRYSVYRINQRINPITMRYEIEEMVLLDSITSEHKGIRMHTFFVDYPAPHTTYLLLLMYQRKTEAMFVDYGFLEDNSIAIFKQPVGISIIGSSLLDNSELHDVLDILNLDVRDPDDSLIHSLSSSEIWEQVGEKIQIIDVEDMGNPITSLNQITPNRKYFVVFTSRDITMLEETPDNIEIADHYLNGYNHFPIDYELANQYCEKAVSDGHVHGIITLARNLLNKENYSMEAAIEVTALYNIAATAGNDDAMVRLADCYIDGVGCAQNYALAKQWLEKACLLGNATAANNLAWLCLCGKGEKPDYQQAVYWFDIAANHPSFPSKAANRHLGKLYLGLHPAAPDFSPKDSSKALCYLQRSKELGANDVDDLIELAQGMNEI